MNARRGLFPNAWLVAVREYRSRVGTKSFMWGTVLLAAIAFGATQMSLLIDAIAGSEQTHIAVIVRTTGLPADSKLVFAGTLNSAAATTGGHEPYVIDWASGDDLAARQTALEQGRYSALLVIDRNATGDLTFTLRTDMPSDGRQVPSIGTAARMLAVEDALARAGTSTASLLAPSNLAVVPVNESDGTSAPSLTEEISGSLLSTGLVVLIFMAIVTYGTWVAMSVAEEKGSRVMELMLNATTPQQMLAGKVLGNGGAGLTQYGAVIGALVAGMLAEGPIHHLVLGGDSSSGPGPLDLPVLAAFAVLFVLGFLLYSLLYAALGSLVSRQEDVQAATSPLMILVMIGYFLSIFSLQAINETWVVLASFIPFFSPYLMLARVSAGHVAPWEFALAVAILAASIGVALVIASRIYSAGVLLYGQRVGLRQVFRAARVSR
jgi:ABC-2 type transport system permease protein